MRKVTSIVCSICFVLVLVTVIYTTARKHHEPQRRGRPPVVSQADGARQFRPPHGKHGFFPKGLHELAGYTFLLFGTVHIIYNGKCLLSYVGIRRRQP